MVAKIIDGRWIAKELREKVAKEVKELKNKHQFSPNIATIRVGKKPESDLYLRLRDNACEEVGIFSCHVDLSVTSSEKEILDAIEHLNKDDDVHGILIPVSYTHLTLPTKRIV